MTRKKRKSRGDCSTGLRGSVKSESESPSLIDVADFIKKDDNDMDGIVPKSYRILFENLLQSKEEIISSKEIIIKELNSRILLLEEKIEVLSVKKVVNNLSSYKDVLQSKNVVPSTMITVKETRPTEKRNNDNILTIRPTKLQDNKITRKEMSKLINPTELGVKIGEIQDLKDGAIIVKCKSKEDITKIRNEVEKKAGQGYNVKITEKKRPRIKIVGLEEELAEDVLKRGILAKNDFVKNLDMKLITTKKMKNKYLAIVEVDPVNFKNIMENGFVFIDFSVCYAYEHIDILRCFKCGGYHHTATTCQKSQICLKCGKSDHKTEVCSTGPENISCPNCCEENEKLNSGYMINHKPFDMNCEVYKFICERSKKNIDYSITG